MIMTPSTILRLLFLTSCLIPFSTQDEVLFYKRAQLITEHLLLEDDSSCDFWKAIFKLEVRHYLIRYVIQA